MRRNRDIRDGRGVTTNKNEQLTAILMRGEDKRRKITPSYINQSLERSIGKSLFDFSSGLMGHFPGYTNGGGNQPPTGGTWDGDDEGAGVDGPGVVDPNNPTPGVSDSPYFVIEPGTSVKPPDLIFETEDPNKPPYKPPSEHPGGGLIEEIDEPGFEGDDAYEGEKHMSDVKVNKVKQPDGSTAFWAFNDYTGLWYQIKFINSISEGQPYTFMMRGVLYYYNIQYGTWNYYIPPGNTSEALYFDKIDMFPSGTAATLYTKDGKIHTITKSKGAEYFFFKGSYYYISTTHNALIPLKGTDSDAERQKIVYSIIESYGLTAAQNFMYNNYDEYYSAWMALYPNTSPISQANIDKNLEKMMGLQWMMIQNGFEYTETFLQNNPEWAIAWSLLNPKTQLSQGYMEQQIKLYESYQTMNAEQKQQFQNAFEISFLFDRSDVMNEFSTSLTPLLDNYLSALDILQVNPTDPKAVAKVNEAWGNLLISGLSFLSNKGGTLAAVGGLATGLTTGQSISFITLQIFRVISSYRYGVNFAPTVGGIAFQTMSEFVNVLKAVGAGEVGLTEGISKLSVAQFAEKFAVDVKDAMQFVHRVISNVISTIRGTAQASSTVLATLGGEEGVAINEAAFADELFQAEILIDETGTESGMAFADIGAESILEGGVEVGGEDVALTGLESVAAGAASVLGVITGLIELAGAAFLLYQMFMSVIAITEELDQYYVRKLQQAKLVEAQLGMQSLASYLEQYPDAFSEYGNVGFYSNILHNYQQYSDPYYQGTLQRE